MDLKTYGSTEKVFQAATELVNQPCDYRAADEEPFEVNHAASTKRQLIKIAA